VTLQYWTHVPPAVLVARHASPSVHDGLANASVHASPSVAGPLFSHSYVFRSLGQQVWPDGHSQGFSLHGVLEVLLEHEMASSKTRLKIDVTRIRMVAALSMVRSIELTRIGARSVRDERTHERWFTRAVPAAHERNTPARAPGSGALLVSVNYVDHLDHMQRTSLVHAKAHLSELVDVAEHRGQRILILRSRRRSGAIDSTGPSDADRARSREPSRRACARAR
jgi:hypothetical protein